MHYEIDVAGTEDKQALLDFAERNFPEGAVERDPDRWDYVYGAGRYEFWFARDSSGVPLGHIATVRATCTAGDLSLEVLWLFNMMVAPEARRHGVASALTRAIEERHETVARIGSNQASVSLSLSLGWHQPPDLPRYVRIVKPSYYLLRAVTKFSPWQSARDFAIAARFAKPREMAEAAARSNFDIEPVDQFGEEVDALRDRVKSHFSFMGDRSADELNYRFLQHPVIKATALGASSATDTLGYIVIAAVLREGERIGFILDWLFEPSAPEVGRQLLQRARLMLETAAVHRIEAQFQPKSMQGLLAEAGFRQWRGGVRWTVSPAVAALIDEKTEAFHLSFADSDLYELCLLFPGAVPQTLDIMAMSP